MMYNSHSQKYNDVGKKFFKINYIVSDFTHKKKIPCIYLSIKSTNEKD